MTRRRLRLLAALLVGVGLVVGLGTAARGDTAARRPAVDHRISPGLFAEQVRQTYGVSPPTTATTSGGGVTMVTSSGRATQPICHGGICSTWQLDVAAAVDFGWEYMPPGVCPDDGRWHIRVMRAVARETIVRGVIRARIHQVVLRDDLYRTIDYTDYDGLSSQPVASASTPTVYGRAPIGAINLNGVGWRSAEQNNLIGHHMQAYFVGSVRWSDNVVSNFTFQSDLTPELIVPWGISTG